MKGYELIKEMPNMKLGTKIRRIKDGQMYKLQKVECKKERKFSRVGNKKGIERFMTYENMHKDFEVIEENKEIKELNKISYNEFKYTDTKHRFDLTNIEYDKINELVREVNKIKKQLEEQETEDIDIVERELNKMF